MKRIGILLSLAIALSGCASSADFVVVDPRIPDGSIRTAGNFVANDRQDLELNFSCERTVSGYDHFAIELANFGPRLEIEEGAALTIASDPPVIFGAAGASAMGTLADGREAEICQFPTTYNRLVALPSMHRFLELTLVGKAGPVSAHVHPDALERLRELALEHPPLASSGTAVPFPKTAMGRSSTSKTLGGLAGLTVVAAGVLGYFAVNDDIEEIENLENEDEALSRLKRHRAAWGLLAIGGLLFGFSSTTD